jgi:hypothetical protein
MTKVKRWDTVLTDINTLCQEIEEFLNSGEVKIVQSFTFGRFFLLIAIFEKK